MPAPFYARRSHAFPSEGKVSPKVTDEVSKTLKNAEKEGLSTPSCGARKTQRALRAVPCVFRPLRQPLLAVSAPGGARRRCPRRCPALGLESTLHSQNKRHDPVGHASCFGGEGGTLLSTDGTVPRTVPSTVLLARCARAKRGLVSSPSIRSPSCLPLGGEGVTEGDG